jgi:hypothetical protein
MIYYVIKAIDIEKNTLYLGHDVEEDKLHWLTNVWDNNVPRFDTSAQAETFVMARKEFTYIENNGSEILMPEMLKYIELSTLAIEKFEMFELEKSIDMTSVLTEFRNRKSAFDIKYKELTQI